METAQQCSVLCILGAAVAYHLIGALWFSLLFSKPWMALLGITKDQIEKSKGEGMAKMYILSFLCGLVISGVLACFITRSGHTGAVEGAKLAAWVAFGFIAPAQLPNYLFLKKPMKLYLIDTGYHVVATIVAGAILGACCK